MFVNGEPNGKSIQRFILITQSHMITLAVPYIILSTILINGEPFSFMNIQNNYIGSGHRPGHWGK